MAAPKAGKNMTGDTVKLADVKGGHPITPPDLDSLQAQVLQLQSTVNELISKFNGHVHGGVTAGAANTSAPAGGGNTVVGGAGVAATNLFTTD